MTTRKYGWKPDKEDGRDLLFSARLPVLRKLPPAIELGSCTANAIGAAHQFEQGKQAANPTVPSPGLTMTFVPSRLFIYYNERLMEGTVDQDAGAQIRDGMKSVAKKGVCPETEWPYITTQFAHRPPDICYTEAMKHQVVTYQRVVQSLGQMRGCLADGFPFVFGFTVYPSFESDKVSKTGKVPMPSRWDKFQGAVGGHAVCCCGYRDADSVFIVRNSWGTKWGMAGCFEMPYAYLTDPALANDLWTVRMVEI